MTSDKLMVFSHFTRFRLECVWIVWWSACSKLVSIFATKHSTAVVVVVVAVVVVTVLNVPSLSTFHLASVPIMSSAQPGTMQSRAQLAAIHCFNNTDTDITIHLAMEVGEGGSWGDY